MRSYASYPSKRFATIALLLKMVSRLSAVGAAFLVLNASFCGPELITPGSVDVSGTWFGIGPAAGLSNITMVLTQTSDGHVSGTFTATGTSGSQVCPTIGPCALSSTINGANTVLQVNLVLKDAGTFTGQLITRAHLRGAMSGSTTEIVEFDRIAAP
ncbi:MAG: hypothetical protein M3037_12160 [Gemmatimonadota bacterium]|nr:hypothetical protein [Gemmatimonadota bacterium]